MTEYELRQKVADTITEWLGTVKGSATHKEILAIYNGRKPLPRGVTMTVDLTWCAATASAAFIKAGIADYVPIECSCYYLIEQAKKLGCWIENDAYTPKLGDVVLYDWQDDANYAKTDNTGVPDHVGIVTKVGMGAFVVTEGNRGTPGKVDTRTMQVNGRYIRGFIAPDYAKIAAAIGGTYQPSATSTPQTGTATPTKEVTATESAHRFDKTLAGTYIVTASSLNVRNGAGTTKKVLTTIPKGTAVKNYGYFSTDSRGVKWLYIQFKQNGTVYTAFASGAYLSKK